MMYYSNFIEGTYVFIIRPRTYYYTYEVNTIIQYS